MSTAIGSGVSTGVFGGGIPVAPIAASFNCDGAGNCSDPGDGTGTYSTLAACNAACPAPTPPAGFRFTVDTRDSGGTTLSNQFALGSTKSNGTYNFVVDWGDGTTDTITAYNQAENLHTYATAGIYTIECTGVIIKWGWRSGPYAGDRLKLREILNWGGNNLNINEGWAFYNASRMSVSATDSPANTGTLFTCFYSMGGGTSPFVTGIGGWDMSNVNNCAYICYFASNFNEDVSGWDVSNIQNFTNAFSNTSMSTANYDALLIAWAPQNVNSLTFGIGSTQYTAGGAAAAARATLVSKGWTITDGGSV